MNLSPTIDAIDYAMIEAAIKIDQWIDRIPGLEKVETLTSKAFNKYSDQELQQLLTRSIANSLSVVLAATTGRALRFGLVDPTLKPWARRLAIATLPLGVISSALLAVEARRRNKAPAPTLDEFIKSLAKSWADREGAA